MSIRPTNEHGSRDHGPTAAFHSQPLDVNIPLEVLRGSSRRISAMGR